MGMATQVQEMIRRESLLELVTHGQQKTELASEVPSETFWAAIHWCPVTLSKTHGGSWLTRPYSIWGPCPATPPSCLLSSHLFCCSHAGSLLSLFQAKHTSASGLCLCYFFSLERSSSDTCVAHSSLFQSLRSNVISSP